MARGIVEDIRGRSPFPVHYIHEPPRGIAIARNRVLDHAAERCAQWIAFIDDHETAEPDWLANLMAPEYRDTPVLTGTVRHQQPDEPPFWYLPRTRKDGPAEGQRLKSALTGNIDSVLP